nr:reverse transcriptase domain-containing protein [Tanacetum cinerariifolium]
MSEQVELNLTPPTSVVRNTMGKGKEQTSKNSDRPVSDATLREYCDKYYHQLLPIIAEKVHQEKVQQEKLKEVKARLNFKGCSGRNLRIQEVSQHFVSRTPNVRGKHRRGRWSGCSRSMSESPERTSVFSRLRCDRSESLRHTHIEKEIRDGGVFNRMGGKEKNVSAHLESRYQSSGPKKQNHSPRVKTVEEDTGNQDLRSKSQAWRKTTCLNHKYVKRRIPSNLSSTKKCVKDLVEIYHIKQREGESTKDFVQRFKAESRHVKGAPECMRISEFMHEIPNPELIKRLHDNIPKSVDEMMRKEILALDKDKFKAPPPMTTPVEKRNNNKFCEFHKEVGHNTDECMHLRRQIEELIKNGKLARVIKELNQGSGKDQPKAAKKGETYKKDKPLAIMMVQPWQRVARQKITKSFFPSPEISFPPLSDEDRTKGPMIIEAEIGGHFIHRIYVDGGSASEILYENCFNRLRLEVKNQMVPATAPLIGFIRSLSPYNEIIGTPGVRKIQAVPSTAHRMLKFLILGGILTLRSSRIIPLECTMVSGPKAQPSDIIQAAKERIKVSIHPEYPE